MDRPFPITATRAALSPMKTVARVRDVLWRYRRGESIGFTLVSSLKSMGLIPRAHGRYELGTKYQ
ncbi:hypothetical protein EBZ80_03460 [bacterium]|nr:hypothetical protein [bacterium]